MRKTLVIILSLLALEPVNAQKKEGKYHSREVIIQVGDTLIRTNILTGELSEKPFPDKRYFWYWKGMINSNIGGYSGKLFHGDYLAFHNNKLIESGQFVKGLKSGVWKSWYLSGEIQKICFWKNGTLDGRGLFYNVNGIVEERGFYKNGTFHSRLKPPGKDSTKKEYIFKKNKTKKELVQESPGKKVKKKLTNQNKVNNADKEKL
jgi:antitoxin component YwqK of YwqJK toxin-antitoxin module